MLEPELKIRGQLTPIQRGPSDLFITKGVSFTTLTRRAANILEETQKITIHATGAAVYKAASLGVMLMNADEHKLEQFVETGTEDITDYVGKGGNPNFQPVERMVNFIRITLTRVPPEDEVAH